MHWCCGHWVPVQQGVLKPHGKNGVQRKLDYIHTTRLRTKSSMLAFPTALFIPPKCQPWWIIYVAFRLTTGCQAKYVEEMKTGLEGRKIHNSEFSRACHIQRLSGAHHTPLACCMRGQLLPPAAVPVSEGRHHSVLNRTCHPRTRGIDDDFKPVGDFSSPRG